MSGIEGVAKTWLADPPWQKVFKHTVDVLQDYVSYILVKNSFEPTKIMYFFTMSQGTYRNRVDKDKLATLLSCVQGNSSENRVRKLEISMLVF